MAIARWDPFNELATMQREMDRLFSRLGGRGDGEQVVWMPRVDVKRSGEDMVIEAELPGLTPDDVDVSLEANVLTIKGERKRREERKDEGYLVREISYGSFERSVAVPENVMPEDIKADFKDGILHVTVPGAFKEEMARAKKIPIATG